MFIRQALGPVVLGHNDIPKDSRKGCREEHMKIRRSQRDTFFWKAIVARGDDCASDSGPPRFLQAWLSALELRVEKETELNGL